MEQAGNKEFFTFLKREFGDRYFSTETLEYMFIAYVAGKYGIPKQVAALLREEEKLLPIDFAEKGLI